MPFSLFIRTSKILDRPSMVFFTFAAASSRSSTTIISKKLLSIQSSLRCLQIVAMRLLMKTNFASTSKVKIKSLAFSIKSWYLYSVRLTCSCNSLFLVRNSCRIKTLSITFSNSWLPKGFNRKAFNPNSNNS